MKRAIKACIPNLANKLKRSEECLMFEKIQAAVEKYLIPVANKMSANKILRAISGGFSMLLPIIMVGAVGSLLSGLSFEVWQNLITSTGLKPVFVMLSDYTTNMMAIYAVFTIGYAMANQLECSKTALLAGVMSLLAFLIVIPLGVGSGENVVAAAMSTQYFGSPGLFTAMIIGVVVPNIYNIFIKHNVVIKMPDGVPPQIAHSFSAIIPGVVIAAIFVIIRQLCALTPFDTLNGLVFGILKVPLSSLTASPLTFAILLVLTNLLWFFGIHGGMVTGSFRVMLYSAANLENMAAFGAGEALPHMITGTWQSVQAQLGGAGAAIGLAVCMFLLAKSKRYKTLGKLSIAPALCSISEPIVFGFPLVLNPIMFVPVVLSPLLCFAASYIFTAIGVLPYLNGISVPTGTPIILAGLMAGGWRTAIWQVVLVALQFVIYLPFFKVMDKQALAEEAKEAQDTNA